MKTLKYIIKRHTMTIGILSIITLLCSCSDFLDLKPISTPSSANFYKTTEHIETALNGCYASLQSGDMYKSNFVTMMEVRSDNVSDNNAGASGGIYYNIDRFTAGSDNSVIRNVWGTCFSQIYRINLILDNIDVVTNASLRQQYAAEAKFLRALTYFNMVRFWGDLPLVLQPISTEESYKLIRNRASEVYLAIEKDLQDAQSLPKSYSENTDLGRATSGAAKTLLAKVYLTQQKYNESNAILEDIIMNYNDVYELESNIEDVFKVSNKLNKEIIFAVRFSKTIPGETGSLHDAYTKFIIDDNLFDAYENRDVRIELIESKRIDGQYVVNKFADTKDPITQAVGFDFPILRYSDVLLMYAEVQNEIAYNADANSPAFTYLNKVRTRAKATEKTPTQITNQSQFRELILTERRLEFPLESHRWFDLIRTGQAIDAMQTARIEIGLKDLLYPIPESEILIMNNPSGFYQNDGY